MKPIPKLDDIFNIDSSTSELIPITAPIDTKIAEQEEDFELSRRTMRKLLMKGDTLLDSITELAQNAETAAPYDAASKMMKAMSEISKDLLLLQKQAKELSGTTGPTTIKNTQNNIVFAGSTQDLLRMLKENPSGV